MSSILEKGIFEKEPEVKAFVYDIVTGQDTFERLGIERGFFCYRTGEEQDSDSKNQLSQRSDHNTSHTNSVDHTE